MAFGDDANLEVMISFEKRNEHVVAEANRLTESLNDAIKENTRATAFNSVSLEFRSLVMAAANAKQEEFNRHVRANTVATAENAVAQQAADAASFSLWGTIKALPGVWAQVILGIAAASLALWPFTMLVGSAVIALTSFMVAGAGFAAIGALVAGVFGAMGVGVLMLGGGGGVGAAAALTRATEQLENAKAVANIAQIKWDTGQTKDTPGNAAQLAQSWERVKDAQAKYNDALAASQGPVGVLLSQVSAMKDKLAEQATPLAALITQWVGGAIPGITQLGSSMMTWFGDRLPPVLAGLSKIIKDLTPDFISFGQYFGGVMDKIGPMLSPIIEAFARLALQGAKGLLDNLVRLSDWFVKELPTLGKVVSDTFGQIGRFIQWVADNWGTLTDFVIKNWDPTVKNVQSALKELQNWWKENGKTVTEFGGNLKDLLQQLSPLLIAFMQLVNFLNGVGLGPAKLLSALNEIVSALESIWGFVTKLNPAMAATSGNEPGPWLGPKRPTAPGPTGNTGRGNQSVGGGGINITIHGTDTNNAGSVARGIVRALGSV
jgi:hypothetical protein